MTDEEWRPVPDWDCYEASSLGRIRSLDRIRPSSRGNGTQTVRGRILKQRYDDQGYPFLTLSQGGRQCTRFVHQLVAAAFLGPCPDGLEVRHQDGDTGNPSAANLAYGTHQDNELDKRAHGTHHNVVKTHCPQNHPYDEANTYVEPSRPTSRSCRACRRERQRSRSGARPGRAA